MRKLALFCMALVLVIARLGAQDGDGEAPRDQKRHGRVLLVSIDACRAEAWRDDRFPMPNLRALAARGVAAKKCIPVFPTLTYPSHTSIATGCRTARHAIVSNTMFDPKDGGKRWFYETALIRATTIWDAAHRAGLTTSLVHWPVSVGARVDWLIPEVFGREFGEPKEAMRRFATPGLFDEVWLDAGHGESAADEGTTHAAAAIIEKHKPELMLVHLLQADGTQHHLGRDDEGVFKAFAKLDEHLGTLLGALETAGVASQTNVIVTGDHGMMDVHTAVKPNVLLRELGFLKVDEKGKIADWIAAANTGGAVSAIYARDPADRASGERVVAALKSAASGRYHGIFNVLDRDALDREEAFPGALCALEGEPGFTMESAPDGAPLGPAHLRGNHGYLPTRDAVTTTFMAAGPGLASGRVIESFRSIDIAPLAAHLLGVDMGPGVEGVVIPGVLAHGKMREDDH